MVSSSVTVKDTLLPSQFPDLGPGIGVGVSVGGTSVGVEVGGTGVGVAAGGSRVEVAVGATDTDELPHEIKKNTDSIKLNICNSNFLGCIVFLSCKELLLTFQPPNDPQSGDYGLANETQLPKTLWAKPTSTKAEISNSPAL